MTLSIKSYSDIVAKHLSEISQEQMDAVLSELHNCKGTVYFIGNGASASMASHFSVDMQKNCLINTRCFHDPSFLTCYSNDFGYENVFAQILCEIGGKDDLLFAISSSGNSRNIINAVKEAKKKGIKIIGFSGFNKNNYLNKNAEFPIFINGVSYGEVEISHNIILHYIIDKLDKNQVEIKILKSLSA